MTSGTTKYTVTQMLDILYHYEKASIGNPTWAEDQKKIAQKLAKHGIKLNEYTHHVITKKEPREP